MVKYSQSRYTENFFHAKKNTLMNNMIYGCENKNLIPIPEIKQLYIHNILNSQINDNGSIL